MADSTFHFGKYKGTPLADIPEAYLEWVIINHGYNNAIRAEQTELEKRGRDIIVGGKDKKPVACQLFEPGEAERAIPSGKHKGKLLSDLSDAAVQGMWSSWNGIMERDQQTEGDSFLRRNRGRKRTPEHQTRYEGC